MYRQGVRHPAQKPLPLIFQSKAASDRFLRQIQLAHRVAHCICNIGFITVHQNSRRVDPNSDMLGFACFQVHQTHRSIGDRLAVSHHQILLVALAQTVSRLGQRSAPVGHHQMQFIGRQLHIKWNILYGHFANNLGHVRREIDFNHRITIGGHHKKPLPILRHSHPARHRIRLDIVSHDFNQLCGHQRFLVLAQLK